MPVADYKTYCAMLENARKRGFAYPAVNVSSMATASAVLRGLSLKKSDGILQISIGGGEYASGSSVADAVEGAIALAEYIHRMARHYNIYVAVHTDHCPPDKVRRFLEPLIAETENRRAKGLPNLFNSHMFDGSTLPLSENLDMAEPLLEQCAKNDLILEIEAGITGGEEDGISNENTPSQKLYTTPADMVEVHRRLSKTADARYLLAASFGNVHGSYKPGKVQLRPGILNEGQKALRWEFGEDAYFWLVFHGGSGSEISDIHEAVSYGVVKMNIDTDTQYAYTRAVADHMFTNYNGVLRIDGEMGNKKAYDPRAYLKKAEQSMSQRVIQAVDNLKSAGTTLFGK